MLLAGEPPLSGSPPLAQPSPQSAILPAALAVIGATIIAGAPWRDPVMILLAGAAAAISGYSRPAGVGAIRFIVYLILCATLLESAGSHRSGAALIFGLGALWNVTIRTILADRTSPAPAPTPAPVITASKRLAHWRRSMTDLAGWQFPIRVVAGLTAASVLRHLWPSHHYGWIVLTVALLTQRPIEHLPVKLTQRALGTAFGVALTWTLLVHPLPPWGLGLLICLMATAAAVARGRNYMAYAAISTPVILIVMDLGRRVETSLLIDRIVATVAGAAIVIALNLALDRGMRVMAQSLKTVASRPRR
jgi:hypothetical protein